jgi:pimeloyl-ACP methyl ester carboxylesterase
MTHPILFVHGMYLNGESWDPWVERASARGIHSSAPSWPFHEGRPAELRADVRPGLGKLTFGDVVAFLKALIDGMPHPPHLVGHSIGGLAVQKLLADGYGRSGVAISPAPPPGVISYSPHFLRANWPHINPLAGDRPIIMTRERFRYTFANTMPAADSDAACDRFTVPESRNVPRSTLTSQARIDFRKPHPPLLVLTGDADHLTPPGMVRRNAAAYSEPVECEVYTGRGHFICNEPGWEQVADRAFDWITSIDS